MLTSQDFKEIEKEASKLYGDLEFEIIQEISERIANFGYANTVALNNIQLAQEMGLVYEDIISLVSKYSELSESQIKEIFETAGAHAIKTDDLIYKEAGLNPMGLSPSMLQTLEATAQKTQNNLTNLCLTTANTGQLQFYEGINKAYMEVSTGVKGYTEAIIDTVKEISKQGAYIQYPSGYRLNIEPAVRMNVLTSVNQTAGRLQLMRAEELGWDLMEISAHSGARPEHAEWQGKVVSRSGQKGYLSLDDIGYGEVTGFQGANCRHTWYPYYKGSSLSYSNKELKDLRNEYVEYNGQRVSRYDATQIQRRMERQIRRDKKDLAGLEGIMLSGNKDIDIDTVSQNISNTRNNLKQKNEKLNDFVKQTKLKKDYTRLQVGV